MCPCQREESEGTATWWERQGVGRTSSNLLTLSPPPRINVLADAVCYVGSHEHTRGDDVLRVPPPSPRCIGGVSKSFRAGLLPTQRRKVWSQCTGPCWGHHLLSGPLPSLWLPGLVIHAAASLRLHSDQVWRSTCKGPVTPASRDASSPGPSSAATRGTHRPSTQPSTDTDHGDIWNRRPGGKRV